MSRSLDLNQLPEDSFLLEASAGTGKTYNLVQIYLQWVVQRGFDVLSIPVLTFTEDAAREMRGRIGTALRSSDHPLGQKALRDLPRAPIGTLHSFCFSLLNRFPLEMGLPFPLSPAPKGQLRTLFQEYLLRFPIPRELGRSVDWKGRRKTLEDRLFALLYHGWGQEERGPFFPHQALRQWVLERPEVGDFGAIWQELLEHFGQRALYENHKVKGKTPGKIREHDENRKKAWKDLVFLSLAWGYLEGFFSFYESQGPGQGLLSFDDMISLVARNLRKKDSSMPSLIQKVFKGIIVDEFQDTDPGQWTLVKNGFFDQGLPVVLIGDPKQSIYLFRGGEPLVYQGAKKELGKEPFLLEENFRSSAQIIQGANDLFSQVFEGSSTEFYPSRLPGEEKNRVSPCWSNPQEPGVLALVHEGTGLNGPTWVEMMARHIALTLSDPPFYTPVHEKGEKIQPRALSYGDIAVLVSSHDLGTEVYQRLQSLGIPCRKTKGLNLFETKEMEQVRLFLLALENPQDKNTLGQLLLGELFSLPWQGWLWLCQKELLGDFRTLLVQAKEDFFENGGAIFWDTLEGIDQLLDQHFPSPGGRPRAEGRILHSLGGERSFMNYQQILEILMEMPQMISPGKIEEYLGTLVLENKEEEYPIYLEREGDTVQILTIHASKGLEYPVVYFAGSQGSVKAGGKAYMPGEMGYGKDLWALSTQAKEQNKDIMEAESHRLFYVAFTRAQLKVIFPLQGHKGSIWDRFLTKGLGKDLEERKKCCEKRGWPVEMVDFQIPIKKRPQKEETFSPEFLNPEQIQLLHKVPRFTSYSGLVKAQIHTSRHEEPEEQEEAPSPHQETLLPRGAEFGNFFHHLLEHLDFSLWEEPSSQKEAHWEECLNTSSQLFWPSRGPGSEKGKITPIAALEIRRLVDQLFHQPIHWISPGWSLKNLSWAQRGVEVEFLMRLRKNGPLPFAPDIKVEEGYLKGFIDLLFHYEGKLYFIDWKTNDLGPGPYDQEKMEKAMTEHRYDLQAKVYLLALHQILKKVEGTNLTLGGGLYIFLRGLENSTDQSSPPREDIPGIYPFFLEPGDLQSWASQVIEGGER